MSTFADQQHTRPAIATSLLRSDFFHNAGDMVAKDVAAAMVERTWGSREELFAAGDASDGFYIVLEGVIRLGLITRGGSELILRDVAPGDLFGEIGALDGGARSAGARVISASAKTAFLSSGRLQSILERHPSALFDITKKLCQRLRETTEQLEGIALYPLRQRLARFILAQGKSRGRTTGGKVNVSIPLSQTALAALLGASRPKTNVAVAELEKAGIIERRGAMFIYDESIMSQEAFRGSHGAA